MTDGELMYCFTRDDGLRVGHYGPHQVGLGLVFAEGRPALNGRWVLERAIAEGESLKDADDDYLDRVRPLLTRDEAAPYFVEVSTQEVAALRRVLGEAMHLWIANGYSARDRDDDQLLGELAEKGVVTALGLCLDLQPVEMS